MKNQIHDSICGCCTDEVHKDIDHRYSKIETTANTLVNMHSRAIALATTQNRLTLLIFNDAMTAGKQMVTSTIYTDSKDFKLINAEGSEIDYDIEDMKIIDAAKLSIWSLYLETPCMMHQFIISFEVDFNFQCGYLKYEIIDGEPTSIKHYSKSDSKSNSKNVIENQFSIITINKNGTFDCYDKETGTVFHQLNMIEDMGDAGDTYNYSPVKEDRVITNSDIKDCKIEIIKKNLKTIVKISYDLLIPEKLEKLDIARSSKLIKEPVEIDITVYKNIKRIDIRTIIQNNAKDHRMRALFPTRIITDHSYAETQFGTIKRDNLIEESKYWKESRFKEKPLPIYSQQKFVDVHNNKIGMAVLNRGLTEYEIYENHGSTIAITLFRGVGYLGKSNLIIRPGRPSGMPIPTPDAEELGLITSEYSLLIHKGSHDDAGIAKQAMMYDASATVTQSHIKMIKIQNKLGHLLPMFDFERLQDQVLKKIKVEPNSYVEVRIDSEELLVSAFKKADSENAIILRVYNPRKQTINPTKILMTTSIKDVFECDFLERNINKIKCEHNTFITDVIKGYSAQTYKIMINLKGNNI